MTGASLLVWFLDRGGWRWVLGGLVALILAIRAMVWLHHYHVLQDKAARTDKAEGQIADFTGRLDAAVKAKETAEKDRDVARAALAQADRYRGEVFAMLRKGMDDAAVRNNPICWPSDSQRRVRNEARDRLIPGFGSVGEGGGMPAVPY